MSQKAVITGTGVICPLGDNIADIYEKIIQKTDIISGKKIIEIEGFDSRKYLGRDSKLVRYMSKETQFATVAVVKTLADRPGFNYDENDICIYAGTGTTGIEMYDIEKMLSETVGEDGLFDIRRFGAEALYSLNPLISFQILPNMPVCVAAIKANIRGNNHIFNPWEGNAAHALLEAFYDLNSGNEKVALAGGSDYKTSSGSVINLTQYGLINNNDSDLTGKPFNKNSRGFVAGEGSAYLLLENLNDENRDYAYARLAAIETASDPDSVLGYSKKTEIPEELINLTLEHSDTDISEIGLIISLAGGNYEADQVEIAALENVFNEHLPEIIAPKEFTGNIFAASPFINIALAAYILKNNKTAKNKILVTGFGIGSEKFCCILEKII